MFWKKRGRGHPELMTNRLIFIDISTGLLPTFITPNSGRLRAESTFFPLCKIINMVKELSELPLS